MRRIDDFDFDLLVGKKLVKALVHYVEPELNILFLIFEDGMILEIRGLEGSEILGASITHEGRITEIEDYLFEFSDFSVFYTNHLLQVRIIGEDWNGHGIEMSFHEELSKTLLVQSIYSGRLPEGWNDCIRLGVGNYCYTLGSFIKYEDIKDAINSWDPINLLSHAPDDEYSTEIKEIYNGSRNIKEVSILANLIYSVFSRCFGNDVFRRTLSDCLEVAEKIMN